jgi:drug/metabolite transporter (DMT)-like permease
MKRIWDHLNKSTITNILAVIIVIGCFIMFYFMMIKEIPAANLSTVNIATGFLYGILGAVVGYYYGASKNGDKP